VSGRNLPFSKTAEIISAKASVIYLIDEIYIDPNVYTEPDCWDPGRYLPGRAKDKKQLLSWLG
jgi:hypothetical protein